MVFKDERKTPTVKKLRLAFSDSPTGPWRDVTEPFTRDWIEGPSVVKIGAEWWIYYDHYTKPQDDHRHGTVAKISEKEAKALQALKR